MRLRLRARDPMSGDRSTAKAFAWGALVSLALSYCGPYSYLRIAPGHRIGIWGFDVPEAQRITLCVGVTSILVLLAVRADRTPGLWIVPMYALAVVGLALVLVQPFVSSTATHKSGLGVLMQWLAAFMAFLAVRESGGPRKRRRAF
jgi:hypothetical protein